MNTQQSPDLSLFCQVLEFPTPAERSAFLDETCRNDPHLRRRIEALLRAHDEAGRFLDAPPPHSAPTALEVPPAPTEPLGTMIGPYKLREVLGEGGMGIVYIAEQEKPLRRKVALKVIKPGMDTREVIARFEAERQALALMDHPNIAKVLDAGTTGVGGQQIEGENERRRDREIERREEEPVSLSLRPSVSPSPPTPAPRPLTPATGRPYFVMELVRGLPITDYCDQRRLSPRERLKLFITVCQAVQHAHQRGIIHRDLKPSNVMITMHDGTPVPKVIDFGVAKALNQKLTEHTLYTRNMQMVGTPLYMSPEQAELSGLDVDTRSDVYSLGVLLYELLTGHTPFNRETFAKVGYDEMRRMIREDEPPRPSHRVSTLAAEARSTVAHRRSHDERRLSKILHGELDWIVMKALEKDRTRRYESASELAQDVERYLNDERVGACPPSTAYRLRKFSRRYKVSLITTGIVAVALLAGTGVSVWQAMEAIHARQLADERLAREVQAHREADAQRQQASLSHALADQRLNEVEVEAVKSNRILASLREMLSSANPDSSKGMDYTVRQLLDDFSDGLEKRFKDEPGVEAAIRVTIGKSYARLRVPDKAEKHLNTALSLQRQLSGAEHPSVADIMLELGWNKGMDGNNADAEAYARKALEIYRSHGNSPAPVLRTLRLLFLVLRNRGNSGEAEAVAHEALAVSSQLPENQRADLASILHNLAYMKVHQGQADEAETIARRALDIHRELNGDSHPETAWALTTLAVAVDEKAHREAVKCLTDALQIFRRYFQEDHNLGTGWTLTHLMNSLMTHGDYLEAEQLWRESLQLRQSQFGENDSCTAEARGFLAIALQAQGNRSEAREQFGKSLAIYDATLSKDGSEMIRRNRLTSSCIRLASFLATGPTNALNDRSYAIAFARQATTSAPGDGFAWRTLGIAQYRNNDWAGALQALLRSIELRSDSDSFCWFYIAMTHGQLGRKDEGVLWYDKAVKWMDANNRKNEKLNRLRAEAAALLGRTIPEQPVERDGPHPESVFIDAAVEESATTDHPQTAK